MHVYLSVWGDMGHSILLQAYYVIPKNNTHLPIVISCLPWYIISSMLFCSIFFLTVLLSTSLI